VDNHRAFLKRFFQAVTDKPLDADDERYVGIYAESNVLRDDPVELLARAIEFSSGESVQLLSGFRGTGKSTELKRLESVLVEQDYKVFFLNMDLYVNTSTPIDVSDFLMALAGAFGDALRAPEHLGEDPRRESYWDRFAAFMTRTKITIPEMSGSLTGAGIKANLKSDPTFRQNLQKHMAGHLGALVADVHKFLEDCVKALKSRNSVDTEIVILVDSLEHIRGSFTNARQVQESVELLFAGHAEKLRLPNLHVVYIVPPYLKVRAPNLGMLYGVGAVQIFPAIKIRSTKGEVHPLGVDAIKEIVARRGDWRKLLGNDAQLEKIIHMSGGNLRDLLRLLSEVIRRASLTDLPVSEQVVEDAINQMRVEFLPIADTDALWLAKIADTHEASFEAMDKLPDLTRFFDTHLVLCYRDGPEWYDVHPLIKEHMVEQARLIMDRRHRSASERPGAVSG
jgi:hypothetical protein